MLNLTYCQRFQLLLLLSVLLAQPASAQLCFSSPATFIDSGTRSQAIEIGDFNGDGKTDIVTLARIAADSLTVYLGDNHGNFPTHVKTQQFGRELFVADFNADTKPDLAIVADSTIDVLLGKGNATFQPAIHLPLLTSYLVGVTGADIDGDGHIDLVTSSHVDGKLLVLKGNGLGGFASPVAYPVAAFPMYAIIADLNGDGKPDLVCGSETVDTMSVLINNGSGSFLATQYFPHSRTALVTSADMNGDGKIDLIGRTGVFSADSIRISYGDGTGHFPTKAIYDAGGGVREMIVADLDNDGKTDIVATNSGGVGTLVVLKRNSTGIFNAPVYYATTHGFPYHLIVADLNGDKKKDLITSTVFGPSGNTTSMEIFLNCGPTQISGVTSNHSFRLFPNPASKSFTVMLNAGVQNAVLRIFDIAGTCVQQSSFSGATKTIATCNLGAGTYLIQVVSDGQTGSQILTVRY